MTVPLDKPVICPILIGRTEELATLYSLIDVARSGRSHVALICGEAGIGKSRLVAEVKTLPLLKAACSYKDLVSKQISPTRMHLCSISCELFLPITLLHLSRNYL